VSGTVYIDDAFVGATDIVQNSNACQTADCTTQFSAKVTSTGVITSENIDFILGDCTKPSTGIAKCTFNTTIFTVAPTCVANRDITTQTTWVSNTTMATIGQTTSSDVYILVTDTAQTAMGFNLICTKQGIDFTTAQQKSNGGTYSTIGGDTDWRDFSDVSSGVLITSTAGAPTLGTVVINKAQWKRQASDLLIRWDYRQSTAGGVGSGNYLFNIPSETGCTIDLAKASGNTSTGIGDVNAKVGNFSAGTATINIAGGVYVHDAAKLKASLSSTSNAGAANAGVWGAGLFPFSTANVAFNLEARVPCVGWQNSNVIIGQFNGLDSCTNSYECTDVFSAKISSTGAVSGENLEWLTGNCSPSVSIFTCPINSGVFTQEPNCTITVDSTVNAVAIKSSGSSNSQLVYQTTAGAGGTSTPYAVEVICQKQGVDYIGKTAKAVAVDQNLRTPGISKVVVYSGMSSANLNSATACTGGTCIMSGATTGNATATFVSTGKYQLSFPAGSFDGGSFVSCNYTCNSLGLTNYFLDTIPVFLAATDGSLDISTMGCGTLSVSPARTNSAISWTCVGVKQ
jgi:hypothetical protein